MNGQCKITFTGDIGFDKYMEGRWKDEDLVSKELMDYLLDTDHLVVNVEGPLYDPTFDPANENLSAVALALKHSMNPEAVSFLRRIDADIWNICNNHIMDAGPEGIDATIRVAKDNDAAVLGAGMNIDEASAPVIIEEAGGIGLIGVGYQRACRKAEDAKAGCFSWSDLDLIAKRIAEVKRRCRWCVIVAHAGEEFTALPSPYTRERFHKYLEMGADIVVTHHPHVPMNYEKMGDKLIFYSLGNFIFDTDYQRSQFNTEKGIILKLTFTEDKVDFDAKGLMTDRENERVVEAPLPDIFADVREDEYNRLAPLSAKMFIENTKRQLRYMKPEEYTDATEEDFVRNFYEPLRSGRVPGETLDFQIIYPLSLKAEEGAWKESKLEVVKRYILEQIPKP